jgi:hypothetical protein
VSSQIRDGISLVRERSATVPRRVSSKMLSRYTTSGVERPLPSNNTAGTSGSRNDGSVARLEAIRGEPRLVDFDVPVLPGADLRGPPWPKLRPHEGQTSGSPSSSSVASNPYFLRVMSCGWVTRARAFGAQTYEASHANIGRTLDNHCDTTPLRRT